MNWFHNLLFLLDWVGDWLFAPGLALVIDCLPLGWLGHRLFSMDWLGHWLFTPGLTKLTALSPGLTLHLLFCLEWLSHRLFFPGLTRSSTRYPWTDSVNDSFPWSGVINCFPWNDWVIICLPQTQGSPHFLPSHYHLFTLQWFVHRLFSLLWGYFSQSPSSAVCQGLTRSSTVCPGLTLLPTAFLGLRTDDASPSWFQFLKVGVPENSIYIYSYIHIYESTHTHTHIPDFPPRRVVSVCVPTKTIQGSLKACVFPNFKFFPPMW